MVGRIEWLLGFLVAAALFVGLNDRREILRAREQPKQERKEVELLGASIREINRSGVMNEFSADRAERVDGVWRMYGFVLRNPEIRQLRARRAVRTEGEITLEGAVTLRRLDGAVYRAERILYDTRKKILRSQGPFRGERNGDIVRGRDFFYEARRRRTRAREVYARYRLDGREARLR